MKIKQTMNVIVDEEQNKQREQIREIDDKIRLKENEINLLNKQN